MGFHMQRIAETRDGVYLPPRPLIELAVLALALFLVGAGFLFGRVSVADALLYVALIVVVGAIRLHGYWKYGSLGRPYVAVIEGTLVFARPGDTRGSLRFVVGDLQKVLVYGLVGRRIYRFVRRDGTYVEATPMWSGRVERCVVEFLQRVLPGIVAIAEPQTFFASIRGDGP